LSFILALNVELASTDWRVYTVKKVYRFSRPHAAEMSLTKLSLAVNYKSILGQGEFG
jgi:hypothetical protein